MDRPSRKTKAVNYCEAKDFDDDDDDFIQTRGPPSKKNREDSKQEQKHPSNKVSSQESNSQPSQKEASRKPLNEKLFDRDLEAAITLSLLNNTDGSKEQITTTEGDVDVQTGVDENTDPTSLHLSNCSVDTAILGLDRISADKQTPPRQRKSTSKPPQEDDDDYQPKPTPDSESDEDFSDASESEDEEFTVKKPDKTKKKEKTTKKEKTKAAPASKKEKQTSTATKSKSSSAEFTPVRTPPTSKLVSERPSPSSASTAKPAVSQNPAGGRVPKWNPPAQVGRSSLSSTNPAVKSPGQGLRLGLSRLVRVKPLHPGH